MASSDVADKEYQGKSIEPGQKIEIRDVNIIGIAAYNPNKPYHPKVSNCVGFIIKLGSKQIYYAGDTDLIEEMKSLKDIDVALLPVGGTYTMNASEAAEATKFIKPKLAIPYHWGDVVGSKDDAEEFAKLAYCDVKLLMSGQEVKIE